jgi:hypothetical protein
MSKPTTVFKTAQHIKLESHTKKEADDIMRESQEKCAIGIGMQLLKRKLITFETEENPGENAGERKITVKGAISVTGQEGE